MVSYIFIEKQALKKVQDLINLYADQMAQRIAEGLRNNEFSKADLIEVDTLVRNLATQVKFSYLTPIISGWVPHKAEFDNPIAESINSIICDSLFNSR